jgi:hypothetical protein
MNVFSRRFLAAALLIAAAPGLHAQSRLCDDSRIPRPQVQRPDACTVEYFELERGGGNAGGKGTVAVVRLLDGIKYGGGGNYGSSGTLIARHFLRTPDDRIVPMGDMPQKHSLVARFAVLQGLGIVPMNAGGLDAIPEKDLYTRLLREDGSKGLCMVYRMRAPLNGEIVDCDGNGVSGEASYAPGTTTWRQAFDLACRQMGGVNCDLKEARAVRVERAADGALGYLVEFRSGARIRVNAANGEAKSVRVD